MIGLGMDMCQIDRIERALQKDNAFLQRFFTPEEQAYIQSKGKVGAQSAAAMFAAKEALLKAMGIGLSGGVKLIDIGVSHNAAGAPHYRLTGAAEEKRIAMGATRLHLSLTHEGGMAGAVAVLE